MMGDLVVRLGLNSKGFTRGLDSAKSKMGSFTSFMSGGFLKVAAIGAAALGVGGFGFGLSLVAEAEQAEVAFATMLGSVDLAKEKLGELKDFAASTPFQLGELRDSARQLLAFGVAGDDLIPTMKTLGDLAAGTQKPIADFVDIYGKVKASGVAAMGDVNRLADRGVPIFSELAKVLGVADSEVRNMVSSGKVGFPEIQKVMENVVGAGGLFEDSMKKQSGTMAGLWSTMKDNVLFVITDIAQALVDGLDIKGLLGDGILSVQSLKDGIAGILPVVTQAGVAVRAFGEMAIELWGMVKDSFVSAFSYLSEKSGIVFGTFTEMAMMALVAVEYGFKNWEKIAGIVMTGAMLGAVRLFGEITHFFTGVIPAVLGGFSDNWGSTFRTAADYVMTVFINIGQNIRTIMGSIWEYIASGGKKPLTLAWTPLTEGFHNSMKEIKIPDRLKSDFEKSLESQFSSLKGEVSTEYEDLLQERMLIFDIGNKKKDQSKDRKKTPPDLGKDGAKAGGPVGAALKGSTAAYSSIVNALNSSKGHVQEDILAEVKAQKEEQIKANKETAKIWGKILKATEAGGVTGGAIS